MPTITTGWISGSPSSTGRPLWTTSAGGYASGGVIPRRERAGRRVIELYDYIGPLAAVLRISVAGHDRWHGRGCGAYRDLQIFQCPANDRLVTGTRGRATAGRSAMLSYCTGTAFMLFAREDTDNF